LPTRGCCAMEIRKEYWGNDTEDNSRTRKTPNLSATASLINPTDWVGIETGPPL